MELINLIGGAQRHECRGAIVFKGKDLRARSRDAIVGFAPRPPTNYSFESTKNYAKPELSTENEGTEHATYSEGHYAFDSPPRHPVPEF